MQSVTSAIQVSTLTTPHRAGTARNTQTPPLSLLTALTWNPLIPVEVTHALRRLVPIDHGVLEGVGHGHARVELLVALAADLALVGRGEGPPRLARHAPVVRGAVVQVSLSTP